MKIILQNTLLSALINCVLSAVTFSFQATRNASFSLELWPFVFLLVMFVLSSSLANIFVVRLTHNQKVFTKISIVFLFSPILVIVWALLASQVMWSQIRELELPLSYSWLIGETAGILALYVLDHASRSPSS
jgi:hypothetical protein